jgi:predicted nucleic acid-binding protein
MKIFIDTNVLLDVLIEREPFYKDSAVVWTMVEKNLVKGYISAISVNNIYYISKKMKEARKGAGRKILYYGEIL